MSFESWEVLQEYFYGHFTIVFSTIVIEGMINDRSKIKESGY